MEKKYLIGAALVGAVFIGGTWVFQDNSVTSKHNAPSQGGQVYDTPAAQTQKPSGGGDVNF